MKTVDLTKDFETKAEAIIYAYEFLADNPLYDVLAVCYGFLTGRWYLSSSPHFTTNGHFTVVRK